MLAKDVVETYGARAEFLSVDWSESELAARYGVRRYPAVFVEDILLAQPDDFGWFGAKGKYSPWKNRENHEKFKADLARMIDLVLRGEREEAAKGASSAAHAGEMEALPRLEARDLADRRVGPEQLRGRVVVVEFWATWCPPCRTALDHLGGLKRRYGERLSVVAVAVESPEADVRRFAETLEPSINVVIGTEEVVAPFGTFGSVPRTFVFDRAGRTAAVHYGAPPDLRDKVEALVGRLAK